MLPIRTKFASSSSNGGDGNGPPRRKTEGDEKKPDKSGNPTGRMSKAEVDEFMNQRMAELASGLPPISDGGGRARAGGDGNVGTGGDDAAVVGGDGATVPVAVGAGAGITPASRDWTDADAFLERRMTGSNANSPNASKRRGSLPAQQLPEREIMRLERIRAAEKRAKEEKAKSDKDSAGADGASDAGSDASGTGEETSEVSGLRQYTAMVHFFLTSIAVRILHITIATTTMQTRLRILGFASLDLGEAGLWAGLVWSSQLIGGNTVGWYRSR